ncbi:MAG: hypothetical protein FJ290_09785 [Planctomycetes bacterium]|nr:hypothetical protein [Planctomycetota bacterium]
MSLTATLALVGAGCGLVRWPLPWPRRREPAPAKKALGLDHEDVKELSPEALDAEIARAKNGLRLTLRTDKTAYQINEPILVDVRLENVTSPQTLNARDIPVYFEPIARVREGRAMEWLFKFQIRTDDGQRLIYQSPDIKVPEADRAEYYHYVTLPPESFVGRRFIFLPSLARGLTNPGTYSLVAAYVVDDDFAEVIINRHLTAQQVQLLGTKLAYVKVWTGHVYSNRVTFHVKRKRFLGIF